MRSQSVLSMAWRVILAALLLVMAAGWTVAPAQASPVLAKVSLTAVRTNNTILLTGRGFVAKQVYNISVRAGKVASARTGYVITSTTGEFQKQFPIPQKLLKYKYRNLDVCVRNARTGQIKCARLK